MVWTLLLVIVLVGLSLLSLADACGVQSVTYGAPVIDLNHF